MLKVPSPWPIVGLEKISIRYHFLFVSLENGKYVFSKLCCQVHLKKAFIKMINYSLVHYLLDQKYYLLLHFFLLAFMNIIEPLISAAHFVRLAFYCFPGK